MRLISFLVVSAFLCLIDISTAFPLKPQAPSKQLAVRRRVAYSVVAVDGGGSALTPPPAPVPETITLIQTSDSIATITVLASSAPPSTETIISTKTVGASEPATTVDIVISRDTIQTSSPTTTLPYIVINPGETPTSSSTTLTTSQISTSVLSMAYAPSSSTPTPTLSSSFTWTSISTLSMHMATSNLASETTHRAEAKHPESLTTSLLPTISTKTYDDGMWHTTYSGWNATSAMPSSASATVSGSSSAQKFGNNG